MQTLRSRKRKLETVLKNALLSQYSEGIGETQIVIGRENTEHEKTVIQIHCDSSEPTEDETETLTGFTVGGMISVLTSIDDKARDEHDRLEGIIEAFVEQETESFVSFLNQQDDVAQFGVWEFQPEGSEDGIQEDLRRYISTYRFNAVVQHETQHNLIN